MKRITRLNAILAAIDEGYLPNGDRKYFSISFVSKTGVFIHVRRAVRSGLRFNMKVHDVKGVQPVNDKNEAIGHVYPVWIHSIINFKEVK